MATHDYVISNASGAAVRADLNNALAAIVTNNSSATAPTTTYAYQWWADTGSSPAVMKLRNAANSAWITLFQLDGEWSTLALENGTASAPSIYFKDSGTDTGIYSPGVDQVAISTNGSQRVTVDSTGRVGIGAASPTSNLDVQAGVASAGMGIQITNTDATGFTNLVLRNTGASGKNYQFVVGGNSSLSPNNCYLYDANAGAVRWMVDGSGRFLVGTSTSASSGYAQYAKVQVNASTLGSSVEGVLALTHGISASTSIPAEEGVGIITFANGAGGEYARIRAVCDGTSSSASDLPGRLVFSTTADGASSPTERMRITNGGHVLAGYTSSANTLSGAISAVGYAIKQGTGNAPGTSCFNFNWTGSLQAWIDTSNVGNVTLTSDYRIKKNIASQVDLAIPRIKSLRPVTYERANYKELFKEDGVLREGFIAHELAEVIPSAVEGEKDAENQIQSINIDALVSVLTKALQEAVAKIETLEAKVAALETP